MSIHDHSDFFRNTNEDDAEENPKTPSELFFDGLNDSQRESLDDFYRTYCDPGYAQDIIYPDGRRFNYTGVTYGQTEHNVFFALNVVDVPNPAPANFSLSTLQKKGDEMLHEEYEVLDVKHVPRVYETGMDRIVYASGSKKIALELGRRIYWIENMIVEDQEIELPFPVSSFRPAPRADAA